MVDLEICAANLNSAIAAHQGGAFRIELCENLHEGGTTPAYGLIEKVRESVPIKVNVLIRPRAGDFVYSEEELAIMQSDIYHCAKIGCDGVVIGILNEIGELDIERNKLLIELAHSHNLSVTFHRAFDCCNNLPKALEQIIALGCESLLTSGGHTNVIEGASTLNTLNKQAQGRIHIMAGGGLTLNNIQQLLNAAPLTRLHGSFRSLVSSKMKYISPHFELDCGMYDYWCTDKDKVNQALTLANSQ